MIDYVVVAMVPVDTAVIPANSDKEAIEKYELPEEFQGQDIFIYAVESEEFCEAYNPNCEGGREACKRCFNKYNCLECDGE